MGKLLVLFVYCSLVSVMPAFNVTAYIVYLHVDVEWSYNQRDINHKYGILMVLLLIFTNIGNAGKDKLPFDPPPPKKKKKKIAVRL